MQPFLINLTPILVDLKLCYSKNIFEIKVLIRFTKYVAFYYLQGNVESQKN
jgi:hypothetical protein